MSKVVIQIADQQRDLGSADPHWINEEIYRRLKQGLLVCVRVRISGPHLNLHLTTPTCGGGGGGCRPPNQFEQEVIELWRRHHLDSTAFNGGNVVGFVQQLRRLVA